MSDLKSLALKRRIQKTGTPTELFVTGQLFDLMKQLIESEHSNMSAEKRKEMTVFASEIHSKLLSIGTKLQESIASTADTTAKDIQQNKQQLISELETVKTQYESFVKQITDNLLLKVDTKVATVLESVELFRGVPGRQGEPGKKGEDGSPDTADQVVEKVNKAGKKVQLSAIEGLTEELRKVRREFGGGKGGGMGNTIHETHAVSSGSTSISIANTIAAGGRAAWLYYQGQHLVYGTDYTINGRIISILFTPVDGTYVDVTYIRGS